jgi:hypothetical protein
MSLCVNITAFVYLFKNNNKEYFVYGVYLFKEEE